MLDLSLACDLKSSKAELHDAIRQRHQGIKTPRDAANYIHEVEGKIHGRRQFQRSKTGPVTQPAARSVPLKSAAKPSQAGAFQSSFALLFLLGLMVVGGWYAPAGLNLVVVTLCLALMLVVLGLVITKNPLGVFISDRNLMSLSRFQMAVWTVLVLGAYFTFALVRIRAFTEGSLNGVSVSDPLNITIDWHLWTMLGISTTSLVGAPLILSTKKDKQPDPSAAQKTARLVDEPAADITANQQGTLYANAKISDARLTDLFQGDELANTAQIDMAKVQMFYFTIIAALCFFVMVFKQLLSAKTGLDSLPVLPEGFVAILGISHGGYLASKTFGHTKEQTGE